MNTPQQACASTTAQQERSTWTTPTISVARIETITENGIGAASDDIFNFVS